MSEEARNGSEVPHHVTPDDPVEDWGFEGILQAIDRGYARDWAKLVIAVHANPD